MQRKALTGWAYNTGRCDTAKPVLSNALDHAVERRLLEKNRIAEVKGRLRRRTTRLLAAVEAQKIEGQPRRSMGPRVKAYFAVQYYAGLRPEEAAVLGKEDLAIPEKGWGELLLSKAAPIARAACTDSGSRRDQRQLKQRGVGEVRVVPCPPPLAALLNEHLERFGTAADGRLFRSLTGQEYSVLAQRPYDLRHACVSTWLAAGVPSTQVAEWAGHSVAVLLRIYAKILAGQEASARERIEQAFRLAEDRE